MANLGRSQIWLTVACFLIGNVLATDPIFKFIPKLSLTPLAVQSDSTYDIEMVVGTHAAANTVVMMHGPFENGHAGMVGVSLAAGTAGSNVAAPDFTSKATELESTAKDGLRDVMFKNFSAISRTVSSTTTTADNTVKLLATMKTVDLPGITQSTTLWVWASVEIGDEYVWVSEEATTIQRSNGDESLITFSPTSPSLPRLFIDSGGTIEMKGKIQHTSASRINAYNAIYRYYLPPYATYVDGSFTKGVAYYSDATVVHNSANNEVIVKYPKVGITDMPDFTFKVQLDADNLHLRAGKSHPAKIHVIMSYCEKADCSPSGIKQESENITFVHTLKQRVAPDTFLIKHIASGRCFSYTSGANSNRIVLKAACTDLFTFASNGALKHVSTGSCVLDDSGSMIASTSSCNTPHFFHLNGAGLILLLSSSTSCLTVTGTGVENANVAKTTTCGNNEKFKFVKVAPSTKRIAMGNKGILASGNAEFFFCNRQSSLSVPSCYYRNGTYTSELKALPVAMAYVKAYDPVLRKVYGIHYTGKAFVECSLLEDPENVYQLDDDLWTTTKGKSGIVSNTDLTDATLLNYPVQLGSTDYAVSLKGVHQMQNSVWKLISRW